MSVETVLTGVAAVPAVGFMMAAGAAVLVHGASYLREKTHNELLARIADTAARAAADGAVTLLTLPPGSNFAAAQSAVVTAASAAVSASMGQTIARMSPNKPVAVEDIVRGELGKLLIGSPGTTLPLQVVQSAVAGLSAPAAAAPAPLTGPVT